MVGSMWQDYETQMFAVTGTNLVDSVSTSGNPLGLGKMFKAVNGVPTLITSANLDQSRGALSRQQTPPGPAQGFGS